MAKRITFLWCAVSVICMSAMVAARPSVQSDLHSIPYYLQAPIYRSRDQRSSSMKFRRSIDDSTTVIDLSTSNSAAFDSLDPESKYRIVEQTLTMVEQLLKSLEILGRNPREEQKTSQKMTVGSGLLQQLDNLERMMRKDRMTRKLDHLKSVKQKLLELG